MKTNYCIFFIKKKLTPKMNNSNIVVTSNSKEMMFCINTIRDMHLQFDMLPVKEVNRNRIALLLNQVESIN